MARRHAPDARGRARLHVQVEHGLDARHARLLRARADPPPLPPRRAHLRDALRVQRALHEPALPRRGRAREALAARRRCRATPGRSSPTSALLLAYQYTRPGKQLLFMGTELAPRQRVEPRREPRLASRRRPVRAGLGALPRRARQPLSAHRVPLADAIPTRRASPGSTAPIATIPWCRTCGATATTTWSSCCNLTPVPRDDYRIGVPDPGDFVRALERRRAIRRQRDGAGSADRRGGPASARFRAIDFAPTSPACGCRPVAGERRRSMTRAPSSLHARRIV